MVSRPTTASINISSPNAEPSTTPSLSKALMVSAMLSFSL
jgi:hypothetical protein